jgi:hypothetical protein
MLRLGTDADSTHLAAMVLEEGAAASDDLEWAQYVDLVHVPRRLHVE